MTTVMIAALCIVLVIAINVHNEKVQRKRLAYIQAYEFPQGIKQKLKLKHPLLPEAQLELVFAGLRDFFYVCNSAKNKMVSMPSQAVDDAWHEFILYSKQYETFCHNALGRYLYHTPAEAMPTPTSAQDGIKRAWYLTCVKEGIDPKKPDKLPLLFVMDSIINIEGGFMYRLDCADVLSSGNIYCASHIGCGGGGCGGCGSGCGAGCGGGCGG